MVKFILFGIIITILVVFWESILGGLLVLYCVLFLLFGKPLSLIKGTLCGIWGIIKGIFVRD